MADTLVITCPSGKQCSRLIPILYSDVNFRLRLAAHSDSSATKLQSSYPNAEVVRVDLTDATAYRQLVEGATSVYHVGPSFHSREKDIGFNMVDAAVHELERPGNVFKHFVFSSVLATQHRNLIQHDQKSYIEERLFLSPLNWTILKPTNFMDAYPVAMLASQEKPVLEKLWKAEMPNSLISLHDLAEASAKVLNEREQHYLAEYPLCSTMPTSDAEVADAIAIKIGKPIELISPTFEKGVEKLLNYLFGAKASSNEANVYSSQVKGEHAGVALANEGDTRSDLARDQAERLILFYNRRGLKGNPNVLTWLLGRQPTNVEQWVDVQLREAGLT